ncbi:MAG: hypothetical protein COA42_09120 [Alteromonadaceae bacterium]|nr:MAG: hypothetical protein COA42_09120 [Alteromonadaceae bacterium]
MGLSVVKNTPRNTVILDKAGIICDVHLNLSRSEDTLGWQGEECLIGHSYMDIHTFHDTEIAPIYDGIRSVLAGKRDCFSRRFVIFGERKSLTYELKAEHPDLDDDHVELCYRKVAESLSTEEELLKDTNINEMLFKQIGVGVLFQSNNEVIVLANNTAQRILGMNQSAIRKVNRDNLPWRVVDAKGVPLSYRDHPGVTALRTGKTQHNVVLGIANVIDRYTWLKVNTEFVYCAKTGERQGVLTSFFDVTEERRTKDAIQSLSDRFQVAIDSAELGVWDWSPTDALMIWDSKMFDIHGYGEDKTQTPMGAWRRSLHPEDRRLVFSRLKELLKGKNSGSIEYRLIWPDNTVRFVSSQARPIRNLSGKISRIVGVSRDVTKEALAEKKLRELAYTDPLTGLASRAGFYSRLSEEIARADTYGYTVGVLMVGLDRFKDINENYGYEIGDKVLKEISSRLLQRISDCGFAARTGGDEFSIILPQLQSTDVAKSEEAVKFRASLILHGIVEPLLLGSGFVINISASIGVNVYPKGGETATALLQHAGLAMHHAKSFDADSVLAYSSEMTARLHKKFNFISLIRNAIKNQEFELYYQPIVDLSDQQVLGCEALIRWRGADGKMISPMEFIPIVEEIGLIYELGCWINRTAIKQWHLWAQSAPDSPLQYMSINVSPHQLKKDTCVQEFIDLVNEFGVAPESIQLEITEGTFLSEFLDADSALKRLAKNGFRLAIDDFGTGYSSLAYLKRFNVDVIKIDRSFIIDIEHDQSDQDIVSAILAMNKKLGFKTIVEGIETEAQARIVKSLGCDYVQGYLFGFPDTSENFAKSYVLPERLVKLKKHI